MSDLRKYFPQLRVDSKDVCSAAEAFKDKLLLLEEGRALNPNIMMT